MTHTLSLFPASIETAAIVVRSRFRWATSASFAAAALCAGAVAAIVPAPAWFATAAELAGMAAPRETPSAAERAVLPVLPEGAGKARMRSRCEGCGVVETIRRVEPVGSQPAGYEFTIRLRDGSTRISSDASPARWHTGDSIMLIGGASQPVR